MYLDHTAPPGDTAGFDLGYPAPVETGAEAEGEESPRSVPAGLGRLVGGVGSEQLDFGAGVGRGDVSRGHGVGARLPGSRAREQRSHAT